MNRGRHIDLPYLSRIYLTQIQNWRYRFLETAPRRCKRSEFPDERIAGGRDVVSQKLLMLGSAPVFTFVTIQSIRFIDIVV